MHVPLLKFPANKQIFFTCNITETEKIQTHKQKDRQTEQSIDIKAER